MWVCPKNYYQIRLLERVVCPMNLDRVGILAFENFPGVFWDIPGFIFAQTTFLRFHCQGNIVFGRTSLLDSKVRVLTGSTPRFVRCWLPW